MKTFFIACTTFTLITLFIFGSLEAGLRILKIYTPPDSPYPQRPDLYIADDDVGYHLWPSTSTLDRYPSKALELTDVVSNADGFRNSREFDAAGNDKRLLMVGDSFVFGLGVNSKDRLTEVLEKNLPGWRVDNMGMGGWGLDLMLRALEKFGPRSRPDVVVLAAYTDDFRRVLPQYPGIGFKIPKYDLIAGELVTKPYQPATGWRKLHLVQAAYEIYWYKVVNHNRYDLNKAILERFYQVTRGLGSRLVLLYLPGKNDTRVNRERRSFLQTWSQSREVPYLDLYDALHNAGIDETYIKGNWHWNERGHRVAANEVASFLYGTVGIDKPATDHQAQ